jgi:hypothetical protein
VVPVSKLLENCNFCVSKNRKIYFMSTYIRPEYLCKVLVENALYLSYRRKKLWLHVDSDFCQKFVFFI